MNEKPERGASCKKYITASKAECVRQVAAGGRGPQGQKVVALI